MLGTRNMARRDGKELIANLDNFHSALNDNFELFRGGKCVAFSDGAFFAINEFNSFYDFYIRVRNGLYQAGIFFRCSLIEGDIEIFDRETNEDGGYCYDKPPNFRSFTFGGKAPEAYQCESDFKGIGCYAEIKRGVEALVEDGKIVENFFIKSEGNRLSIVKYYDIPFSMYEISSDSDSHIEKKYRHEIRFFREIVMNCHASVSQSKQIGGYYLPIFILAIRSSEFTNISYSDENGWSAPYIFKEIMDGGLLKVLKDMNGVHLLLLALFDHLFRQTNGNVNEEIAESVVDKMILIPKCFQNLEKIPSFVISDMAKKRAVEIKASKALRNAMVESALKRERKNKLKYIKSNN